MVLCDAPDSVCCLFPVCFVKIDDENFCVAVPVENILPKDIAEPVIVAFKVGDDCGIA